MVRTTIIRILVVATAFFLSAGAQGFENVAHAAEPTPAGAIAAQSTAFSLGQLVLRETFDDNKQDSMWRAFADEPTHCKVDEINSRLELLATGSGNDLWAGYISNGWRLDPRDNFSMKVDFHYDLVTYPKGSINIGITPDGVNPWERHVTIGVGCSNLFAHYWHRQTNGLAARSSSTQRFSDDGTLYISYNAAADELYVSIAGYGVDNAWTTVGDLLKGDWGGKPVFIWLAGNSVGLAVTPGHIYLDNLLVESGTVVEASLQDVYRFWAPRKERHFYTLSEAEKEKLLVNYRHVWTYEGVAYQAYADDSDPDTRPVHRFWSDKHSSHFYTIREAEKNKLLSEYATVWRYEGVAFYAYPSSGRPTWAKPVHRFWSGSKGAHFYTIDEVEKDKLLDRYGHVWKYEGIAWYAND